MNEIANQKLTENNQVFGIFAKLNKTHKSNKIINASSSNKRHLRAEGFLLLPSALRPRLLSVIIRKISNNFKILLGSSKVSSSKHSLMFPVSLVSSIILSSIIFQSLCSVNVSAASITLTIPSSFSLDITPSTNGAFVKSDSKSINVKTDNSSGYTLSIKAKNSENSNSLINSSNNSNNKLNSISEQTSEDNFKSDSKFDNTWGYMPSKFNSEDNTNFLPGPTTEGSILEVTEEANNETGIDYNISIGAKIDSKTPSGNYNNDFVFSAISNAPKYDAIMQDWAEDYANCENLQTE